MPKSKSDERLISITKGRSLKRLRKPNGRFMPSSAAASIAPENEVPIKNPKKGQCQSAEFKSKVSDTISFSEPVSENSELIEKTHKATLVEAPLKKQPEHFSRKRALSPKNAPSPSRNKKNDNLIKTTAVKRTKSTKKKKDILKNMTTKPCEGMSKQTVGHTLSGNRKTLTVSDENSVVSPVVISNHAESTLQPMDTGCLTEIPSNDADTSLKQKLMALKSTSQYSNISSTSAAAARTMPVKVKKCDSIPASPPNAPVVSVFFQTNEISSALTSLTNVWWKSPEKSINGENTSKVLNSNTKSTKSIEVTRNPYQQVELSTAVDSLANVSWNSLSEEPVFEESLGYNGMQSMLNFDQLTNATVVVEEGFSNKLPDAIEQAISSIATTDANNNSNIDFAATCSVGDVAPTTNSASHLINNKDTNSFQADTIPPKAVSESGASTEVQSYLDLLNSNSAFFETQNIDSALFLDSSSNTILQEQPGSETTTAMSVGGQLNFNQITSDTPTGNGIYMGSGNLYDLNTQDGYLFNCNICGEKFMCTQKLEEHFSIHKADTRFSCNLCNKVFAKRQDVVNHLNNHKISNSFECEYCCCVFTSQTLFERHVANHENGGNNQQVRQGGGPLICTVCGKGFLTQESFGAHFLKHYEDRPYRCEYCNKCFKTSSHLNEHIRIHKTIPDFRCTECDKAFLTQSKLNRHIRVHTREKPYPCQLCGKTFRNPGTLKRHSYTHLNSTFQCFVCGKKLKSKESLVIHNRIHTGEKPYTCTTCGLTFNDPSNYRRHLSVH